MTPAAFKAARNRLGLSAASLGAILNVNERTVRKWEQEGTARPPNAIACRVLEWMLEGYRPPQWPS
jgi:DNA-binding transcriptional regulator YiaG